MRFYKLLSINLKEIDPIRVPLILETLIHEPEFYEDKMMRLRVIETMKVIAQYEGYKTIEELFDQHRELDKHIIHLAREPYKQSFSVHFLNSDNPNKIDQFIRKRKENIYPQMVIKTLFGRGDDSQTEFKK